MHHTKRNLFSKYLRRDDRRQIAYQAIAKDEEGIGGLETEAFQGIDNHSQGLDKRSSS